MNRLIDAHTHIQFPAYDSNREEVIKRAQQVGVQMLCVGTQFSTSELGIKLAEKYPKDIWAAVGFHPSHVASSSNWHHDPKEQSSSNQEEFNQEKFLELAKHPKVVAIGECGLDYYRIAKTDTETKTEQKKIFLQQAEIAQEVQKPLMIHCRPSKGTDDAYEDIIPLVASGYLSAEASAKVDSLVPILHFYVGSLEITKKLVAAGFYFTFGGVITFSRDYDEIIQYTPLDRILLETDAPYVAPEPYRGKQNEPSYLIETAKKMAELKNIGLEELSAAISKNSQQIFKLK